MNVPLKKKKNTNKEKRKKKKKLVFEEKEKKKKKIEKTKKNFFLKFIQYLYHFSLLSTVTAQSDDVSVESDLPEATSDVSCCFSIL